MDKIDIQEVRDMFDHLFLANAIQEASAQTLQVLQNTWLEWLESIIQENKKKGALGHFASKRPLLDLVQLSFFMYSTLDTMPVTKKTELPETNGNYKFIIAWVNTQLDGVNAEKPYLIMLATPQTMHRDIADWLASRHQNTALEPWLSAALKDMKINVIGGWWIGVDHDTQNLQVNQSSGNYWSLSNELVTWFLEDYKAKWYTINIDMDNQWKFENLD